MLYILTSIWVLRTPNTGQNMQFYHFLGIKATIYFLSKKFAAKLSKNGVLKICTKILVQGFIPRKNTIFCVLSDEKMFSIQNT